ncbi:MAG: hypothetical protein EAX96_04940 [Candidatus Lokiarchaeota archaeon]|nr:hypothetical protein [Candidatus Lokiarchaeota archaeon]
MTYNIEFNKKLISEAEKDYTKLNLDKEQKMIIENTTKIYLKYLNISEMAMKGFISRAMREWQIKSKKDLSQFNSWSKNEMTQTTRDICNVLKQIMTKIVVKQEQVPLLEKAIDESIETALKNF